MNMAKKIENISDIPGVGDAIVRKLKSAGFQTLQQIATSNPRKLAELEGIGDETATKLIVCARSSLGLDDFLTGVDIERDEEKIIHITTSSKELDDLLLHPSLHNKIIGGVESMLITEAYAANASGKSQIGFQLAVNVQLPKEKGGLESGCIFLDTESTFKSIRVREIALNRGLNADEILKNIYCARVLSTDHFLNLLIKAEDIVREGKAKLIIVDSIMAPFRREYRGREELPTRQGVLNEVLFSLQNIANRYNIPIYVTNQVMANPQGTPYMDNTLPIGGNILAHATARISLRKGKDNRRVARLVDSSSLPLGEAMFQITEKGIEDVET